jgi:hypothetical protein
VNLPADMTLWGLFVSAFFVAFSGALMPGPVMAVTITHTTRHGHEGRAPDHPGPRHRVEVALVSPPWCWAWGHYLQDINVIWAHRRGGSFGAIVDGH